MFGLEFVRDLAVVMVISCLAGWVCHRFGLSLVVGYLAAGALIGPYTPPFQLVTDLDRIQLLSQLGLVFLIFSIGLNLSFQKLRRLGFSVVFATFIGAVLVLNGCRIFGLGMGWNSTESFFVAGMLMVSSSAIISKVLQELNMVHRHPGQLALGVTVMEDIVAVIMIALLSTLIRFGDSQNAQLAQTLGSVGAFVLALLFVALLWVPRVLTRLRQSATAEVRTLFVIGLLLSLAWLAARAGYSLALGAFLLGVIIAGTPQKPEIERMLEGIRDMFGALFFAAMGMLVDFKLLADAWHLVLLLTLLTLTLRTLAIGIGLVLSGHSIIDSTRAGLGLTPLGEFSFVIAQMGVAAAVLPATFFPMAVGASLLTTLIAPFLMRRSDYLSKQFDSRLPVLVREWVRFYHAWLKQVGIRRQRSLLWGLMKGRLIQITLQIFCVSTLIYFASPIYENLDRYFAETNLYPNGFTILFWTLFGLLLLAPVVAMVKSIEALSMIVAESITSGLKRQKTLSPLLESVLKTMISALVFLWILALLPFGLSILWVSAVVVAALFLLSMVFRRRLVRWQSRLEIELQTQIKSALASNAVGNLSEALDVRRETWQLLAEEFLVPDYSVHSGKTLKSLDLRRRFGCSVVHVDRHGFILSNPTADTVIYPRDKLLLLGHSEQISAATNELSLSKMEGQDRVVDELELDVVLVPVESRRVDKTLAELESIRQMGIQVAGIQHLGKRILTPSGSDRISAGDELLVLGTARQIEEFRLWLNTHST